MSQHICDTIENTLVKFTEVDGYWYWQESVDDDWLPALSKMTHLPIVYGHETLEGAAQQARGIIHERGSV